MNVSTFNTTTEHALWYPRDVDNELLITIDNITLSVVLFGLVLGIVIVASSLKSLSEFSNASGDKETRNKDKQRESWAVHKLKSKYAPIVIICGNGALLIFMETLWFILHFDVGGQTACGPIQRMGAVFYGMSLWTSYVIFEIRRISTGTENFKGIQHWIMQAVRFGTLCTPLFSVGVYIATSGIYLADVQICVLVANPTLTLIFGPFDGMLSAGHIMLFIFAVRQKSAFRFTVVGSGNRIKPSPAATSPKFRNQISLMNKNLTSSKVGTTNKIKAIARRNLELALITVTSTAISMVVASWANIVSPPSDSSEARSYFYLRHFSQLVAILDAILNSLSILVMTSAWQPRCLKQLVAKIRATRSAVTGVHQKQESEVSSLGGGS